MFSKFRKSHKKQIEYIFNRYESLESLGEGTYGYVLKVRDIYTNRNYALKMIKNEENSDGISSTSLREICALKKFQHPNIVQLFDVHNEVDKLGMIFEYCQTDLPQLIKQWMFQLFSAIEYLHSRRYLHRDLKPQNIFIDENKNVKLGDFGLVRAVTIPIREYTTEIITLWYRPPEILLGDTRYDPSVDIWSLGAIFGEMALGMPIYKGESEFDQVCKIFRVLGVPDENEWPDFAYLKQNVKINIPRLKRENLEMKFSNLGINGVDLFERCNMYNPCFRITAKDALKHPYFY